jgi:hypothetical protein
MIPLAACEETIDASGAAPRIEAMLPTGVRSRQLSARALPAGMRLTQADGRPAHLTRVHQAPTSLPEEDQVRLGIIADRKRGPHLLTCRQTERTFGLAAGAPGNDEPGGLPSQALQALCDNLPEASIPAQFKDASTSLAVDWTDMESFSRPPPARGGDCAGPGASGDTARTTCRAARTSCSTATTPPQRRSRSRRSASATDPSCPKSTTAPASRSRTAG